MVYIEVIGDQKAIDYNSTMTCALINRKMSLVREQNAPRNNTVDVFDRITATITMYSSATKGSYQSFREEDNKTRVLV